MAIETFFPTHLYRARLGGAGEKQLLASLADSCRAIAVDDGAGQAWCAKNNYRGYTSYGSLTDLGWRDPAFADLEKRLDPHIAEFARAVEFDLGGRPLVLDNLWINIVEPGGMHAAHVHPHSVISGTLYLELPPGAAPLKLEDPRLPMMMAAPPRKARARPENRTFVTVTPTPGMVVLWESWLRHEVPLSDAEAERISVSFNYRWG
ncbi:MAG: hypothetical protein IV086_00545 [Hyphomonadaceae bacterium]|nr:MAG: hypothetical protein FD160_1364 [Caulobacteraceae bacterium]MBT9444165.1 hypothetical protein [Hyphomonadaceae bacterium]TPW04909.1 MAG: hypothetical protein FD124_2422 [Alphaproteobacteria bacterium]